MERIAITGDLNFVHELLGSGASELNFCYQCSTCTVVCPITPDSSPFPRKEMVQAQFGMKDKLMSSLDSWLCIHCNDCSTHCPRGAKPGDVMNVIRSMSVEHYSMPGFMARAARSASHISFLFLIPMVIIGAVIMGFHAKTGFGFLEGEIVYAKMLPVWSVDAMFIPVVTFAGITILLALFRFLRALSVEYPRTEEGQNIVSSLLGAIIDIFSHRRFVECGTNKARAGAHLLAMYGFIGLVITTTLVGVFFYMNQFGMEVAVTPYDFFHPIKLLGNISGTLALLGCILIVTRRMSKAEAGSATAFDWIFVWVLFLTVITGFLAQVFRVFDLAIVAYFTYYIHLVFVFFLLAYAGYTKMAHIFFRAVAMIYARWSGRSIIRPLTRAA